MDSAGNKLNFTQNDVDMTEKGPEISFDFNQK